MRNGYFRLVDCQGGYGLEVNPSEGDGEEVRLREIVAYLDNYGIACKKEEIAMLIMEGKKAVYFLGAGACPEYPENYKLEIGNDRMLATARFVSASSTGKRLSLEDFLRDLKFRNIVCGIQTEALQEHFQSEGIYCTDIVVAKGQEPTPGVDAKIEYLFDTDSHKRPTIREDGSVDYFSMTTINQCKNGDVLARIIPEVAGVDGYDICGTAIKAREPRSATLNFDRNISLSEDRNTICSMVDGHVSLIDGKVHVSDVFEVKNVDVSTGNLEYEGSIQINGDVSSNFEVKAGGNVFVNGLVECAKITAGGNIVISKGMNGASGGILKAGGDVIVKYLENTRVVAGGFVQAEAILHSQVSAGTEVIVEGKRGLIVGGHVQAARKISAKSIGTGMGAPTVLEVGVNPLLRAKYNSDQRTLAELTKTIQNAETILENFKDKLKKGFKYNESQIKYMKSVMALVLEKQEERDKLQERLERLRQMMEIQKLAEITVRNEIFPRTTIIIGEESKTMQTSYRFCKFVREDGEIKMIAL